MDFKASFDIGGLWEVPYYAANDDIVWRTRPALYVGGSQWVMFQLWYWKFWFYFDLYPVKFTFFDWYLMFDVVNYDKFCTAAAWELDVARIQLWTQVDVNECNWGLIGAFMTPSQLQSCSWASYVVRHPIFDWEVAMDQISDIYFNSCEDEDYHFFY